MKTRTTILKKKTDFFLYLTCSIIWGTTWLAIKFQIDSVSPQTAVFYRFLMASLLLFSVNLILGRRLRYSPREHLVFALQGMTYFSLNYILTYKAEIYASSGIIAMTGTAIVHFNILGLWLIYKKPIRRNVFLGAVLGVFGIYLLFYEDIHALGDHPAALWGITLGLCASIFSSVGNMFGHKNHLRSVPVLASNAWGMLYGTIFTLILCLAFHEKFIFPASVSFWSALVYLSVFGSAIAFGSYISLIGRIGADRAAYVGVISPVIALMISAAIEGLKITPFLLTGMVFCLLGNVLTLRHPPETTGEAAPAL